MRKYSRSIGRKRTRQLPTPATIFLWACFGFLLVSATAGAGLRIDQSLWNPLRASAAVTDPFTPGAITTYPTIQSAGIELAFTNDTNGNASVGLAYRILGNPTWQAGHDLVRIRVSTVDSFAGSLFFLQPATTYQYKLLFSDPDGSSIPELTGSLTTLPDSLPEPSTRSLYVSTTGNDGNSGASPAQAFRTIKHAADISLPGDVITVAPGQYDENVLITRSGTPSAPILYRSEEIATTLGSNPAKVYAHLPRLAVIDGVDNWQPTGDSEVYYTELTEWSNTIGNPNASDNPSYVAVDDDNLYSYWYFPYNNQVTYQNFLDGIYCRGGQANDCLATGIDGGYFYDYLAKRLFVRLPDGSDPDTHVMHVSKRDFYQIQGSSSFRIRDASHVIIRGFEVGFAHVGLWIEGKNPSIYSKGNIFEKTWFITRKQESDLAAPMGFTKIRTRASCRT